MALPENLSIRFDRKRWSAADLLPERLFLAFLELRVIAASCGLSCLWPSLQPITYFWTYAQKRVNLHRVFINKLADLGVRYSLPIKRCSTSVCHKSVFIFGGDFPLLVIHTFFFWVDFISTPYVLSATSILFVGVAPGNSDRGICQVFGNYCFQKLPIKRNRGSL